MLTLMCILIVACVCLYWLAGKLTILYADYEYENVLNGEIKAALVAAWPVIAINRIFQWMWKSWINFCHQLKEEAQEGKRPQWSVTFWPMWWICWFGFNFISLASSFNGDGELSYWFRVVANLVLWSAMVAGLSQMIWRRHRQEEAEKLLRKDADRLLEMGVTI